MAEELTSRLRAVLAGPLAAAGVDLEGVDVTRAGRRRLVRVSVDADGGVSLDRVAELSRLVSATLDDTDAMGDQPYELEVGSPGVSRPLTELRHWRRNVGRLVRITVHHSEDVLGRIVAATDDTVTVSVRGQETTMRLADVRKAVVQVEMERGHGH